ncbi:hypothetical protein ACNQFZ_21015 [Schinkia sp. CFF1]
MLSDKWNTKNNQYRRTREDKEKTEDALFLHEKEMTEILDELSMDAEESAFMQHSVNASDFKRHQNEEFDFSVWIKEIGNHERVLTTLRQLVEEQVRLSEDYKRLEQQSSEKKRELDKTRKNLDHLGEWFTEVKHQLETQLFTWIGEHPKLVFSQEQLQTITRAIEGLYENNHYDLVREPVFTSINDYIAQLKTEKNLTETAMQTKEQEIRAAKDELHYWKTLKMPNPERAEDTDVFRTKLSEEGQAFLPFYAAVEFQDHVTEEQKERIESALKQTGLLDSLITEQSLAPVHDRMLRTEPVVLGYTLADYLKPDLDADSPISNKIVDEVLRSISLESNDTGFHIDVDGSYTIGCMIGHAPNMDLLSLLAVAQGNDFSRKRFANGSNISKNYWNTCVI